LDATGAPPGNDQEKVVAFDEDSLIIWTTKAAQPLVGEAEKFAIGAVLTTEVFEEEPQGLVTVNLTT
jgi:hypothetical protein